MNRNLKLSAPSPRAHLLGILVFAFIFLTWLNTGAMPAANDLDPSWQGVLAWAIGSGKQFGQDIIFTYGPLGFLRPYAPYFPDTYAWYLAGQVAVAVIVAYPLSALLPRLSVPFAPLLLVLCAIWYPWISIENSGLIYFAASTSLIVSSSHRTAGDVQPLLRILLLGMGAAVLSLQKFIVLPLALLWAAGMGMVLWIRGERRATIILMASYLVSAIVLWLACGQHLANIPEYLSNSLEIASGYNASMGLFPVEKWDLFGSFVLLAVGFWLIGLIAICRQSLDSVVAMLILGCIAYLGWKAGFTRADGHINITAPVLAVLPAFALAAIGRSVPAWPKRLGFALIAVATIIGLKMLQPPVQPSDWTDPVKRVPTVLRELGDPDRLVEGRRQAWEAARTSHALPRIAAWVGRDTVDIVTLEQGVLLLNGFNYRPRPVFQSYSAYTPSLMRANRNHFLGANAPDWVLFKLWAIDERFPMSEDGAALLALLEGYQVVEQEQDYLLFKRTARQASPIAIEPEFQAKVQLGEWVDVPNHENGKLIAVALDAHPSMIGKLYGLVFRGAALRLEVEDSNHNVRNFRIIAGAAKTGFLLSPFVASSGDMLAALASSPESTAIKRFRLLPQHGISSHGMFRGEFGVGFRQFSAMPLSDAMVRKAPGVVEAGFSHAPSSRTGLTQLIDENGKKVLFMHAPASIQFKLPAGRYVLEGAFGIRDAAVSDAGCLAARPDGIVMKVTEPDNSPHTLLLKHVDPFRNQKDRGPQPFSIPGINLPKAGTVLLEIGASPEGENNTECDWGYVRDIRFLAPDQRRATGQ